MKTTWKRTSYGQVGIHCEPGEYDAFPPVNALLLDIAPTTVNNERLAIAAYLAFGRWTSGDFHLPRKLGPATAAAIERDLQHVDIRPGPLEYYPKALEIGSQEVSVHFGQDQSFTAMETQLNVLPASQWNGGIRGLRSIHVASNAFALDAAASTNEQSIRARLAVAVIMAGELSADVITLPKMYLPSHCEVEKLDSLLLAARLGLNFS